MTAAGGAVYLTASQIKLIENALLWWVNSDDAVGDEERNEVDKIEQKLFGAPRTPRTRR